MSRPRQKQYRFDCESCEKSYTQLAADTGMSEATIRHWARYGVPENRLDRFCLAAGNVRWTDPILERVSNG